MKLSLMEPATPAAVIHALTYLRLHIPTITNATSTRPCTTSSSPSRQSKVSANRKILLDRTVASVTLTERERLVLDLYFCEGLRSIEIARRLGVTEARISQNKRSALEKLAAGLVTKNPLTHAHR
jgi:RNA polymerase sigma factor (sigma-70 family)